MQGNTGEAQGFRQEELKGFSLSVKTAVLEAEGIPWLMLAKIPMSKSWGDQGPSRMLLKIPLYKPKPCFLSLPPSPTHHFLSTCPDRMSKTHFLPSLSFQSSCREERCLLGYCPGRAETHDGVTWGHRDIGSEEKSIKGKHGQSSLLAPLLQQAGAAGPGIGGRGQGARGGKDRAGQPVGGIWGTSVGASL